MSKNLVPIEERDLARYLRMQTLADEMAEYIKINKKEEDDFQQWCVDNDLTTSLQADTYTLDKRHLDHIYGTTLYYQHLSGYDIAPYCFTSEFLKEEG